MTSMKGMRASTVGLCAAALFLLLALQGCAVMREAACPEDSRIDVETESDSVKPPGTSNWIGVGCWVADSKKVDDVSNDVSFGEIDSGVAHYTPPPPHSRFVGRPVARLDDRDCILHHPGYFTYEGPCSSPVCHAKGIGLPSQEPPSARGYHADLRDRIYVAPAALMGKIEIE